MIGKMGLINGTVSLDNNYELWQEMFFNEKKNLENIFNKDNFTIEHVGSTAVKGLSSKPIIDIVVGVNQLNDLNKYIDSLEKLYTVKSNIDKDEILLIKENESETFFLIHVLPINSNRYVNLIKFRDILINNPDILKQYEDLKIELAKKYKSDRKKYTKSKNNFINDILNNTK
jgi:GrpB-like predicted nucleotidyltransferase (UPF0157 family)